MSTKWVAPGTGANLADLATLYRQHTGKSLPIKGHNNDGTNKRTNLSLTGGPLTTHDLERMEYVDTE